jgi:membrane protease YdiL (CAAX protease family)
VIDRLRLLLAFVAPALIVAIAMGPMGDVRVAFLGYVLGGCLAVPWLLVGARPGAPGGYPFRGPGESKTSSAIAVLVFGPVFLLIYWAVRRYVTAPEPYLQALVDLGWQDQHRTAYLLAFVACVPLAEEWWWRGQALPRARRLFGDAVAVALVALGFAAYHAPVLWRLYPPEQAMLRFGGIVVAAIVWTIVAARRRSWGWVWWAHLAADAALVIAFLLWVVGQA